jgi:hypothetical protein
VGRIRCAGSIHTYLWSVLTISEAFFTAFLTMESQVPTDSGSAVDDVAGTGQRLQPQQRTLGVSPTSEMTDSTISNTTLQNAAASPSDSGEGGGAGPKPSVPSSAAAAAKVSRKRTKTGCLSMLITTSSDNLKHPMSLDAREQS